MKNKIALIVCGNSGLDYFEHEDIEILRSTLNLEGQEYEDFIDITAESFYNSLRANSDMKVLTSQTSVGIIAQKYSELLERGFTECLVITVSGCLSGTFSCYNQAKDLVPELRVHVYDSKTVSYVEGYMGLIARKMIREGNSIPEIIPMLDFYRDHNKILFLVNTVKFLVKNGRLSVTKGLCASLLKIKPLLTVEEGKVESVKKIRTKEKAHKTLIEEFIQSCSGKKIILIGLYTDNLPVIQSTIKEVEKFLDIEEIVYAPIAPVIGVHVGYGAYALAYIEVKEYGK